MAAFVGAGVTIEKTAGATTVDLTLPAGSVVGQRCVASWCSNSATLVGTQTGFTTKGDRGSTVDTLAPVGWLGTKTLSATDITNGFVTLDSIPSAVGSGAAQVFASLTATDDFTVVFVDKTSGTTFTCASQTITQEVVVVYTANQATVTSSSMSVDNSFTETNDRVSGRNFSMGYRIFPASGTTGTTVVTSTVSTRGVGLMIGLRAAYPFEQLTPTPRYL